MGNKEHVSKVEQIWINHYGTLLGYDSIEEQRNPNLYEDEDDEEEVEEEETQGINAVIKLNANKKLGRHRRNTPCLILSVPDKKSRKFHVRLAAPFETEEHWVSPDKYQVVHRNEEFVSQVERQWVNYHQQPLGYDSIELQQQCVDTYDM